MARYGRDFSTGRFSQRGDFDSGYDSNFTRPSMGRGGAWTAGLGQGWNQFGGRDQGNTSGWGMSRDAQQPSWRRESYPGRYGRFESGSGSRSWPESGEGSFGSSRDFGYGSQRGFDTGREFGYGTGSFGGREYGGRNFPGRSYSGGQFGGGEMYGSRRMGEDYDRDFGDRLREGWHRLRNEARGWMGRGYDRGW